MVESQISEFILNSVNLCAQSGFMYSDFVTTVSPTYAKEVLTPEVWKLSYKNLQKFAATSVTCFVDVSVRNFKKYTQQ